MVILNSLMLFVFCAVKRLGAKAIMSPYFSTESSSHFSAPYSCVEVNIFDHCILVSCFLVCRIHLGGLFCFSVTGKQLYGNEEPDFSMPLKQLSFFFMHFTFK